MKLFFISKDGSPLCVKLNEDSMVLPTWRKFEEAQEFMQKKDEELRGEVLELDNSKYDEVFKWHKDSNLRLFVHIR